MLPTIVRRNSWPNLVDELFNDGLFPKTFNWDWNDYSAVPAVNITESETDYKIEVAAPGLSKDDFKINVENDVLTISSEKKEEKEEKKENVLRKEFGYCSFKRSFDLNDAVNADKITASHKDGILSITLPKKEEEKKKLTKEIKIS